MEELKICKIKLILPLIILIISSILLGMCILTLVLSDFNKAWYLIIVVVMLCILVCFSIYGLINVCNQLSNYKRLKIGDTIKFDNKRGKIIGRDFKIPTTYAVDFDNIDKVMYIKIDLDGSFIEK